MNEAETRWDITSKIGHQAEMWVADLRRSLQGGTVEVKRDTKFVDTGNIYVEYSSWNRTKGAWIDSGIAESQADLWVFVLIESSFALVIARDTLKAIAREYYRNPACRRELRQGKNPTKGVCVPVMALIATLMQQKIK